MKFENQAENFRAARRALMLPHPHGDVEAIRKALVKCREGLQGLDREAVDDDIQDLLHILDGLLDISEIEDASQQDPYLTKARLLTSKEESEFSRVVDELASWFDCTFMTR